MAKIIFEIDTNDPIDRQLIDLIERLIQLLESSSQFQEPDQSI